MKRFDPAKPTRSTWQFWICPQHLRVHGLSWNARAVYMFLLFLKRDKNQCYCKVKTISRETLLSKSTVIRSRQELKTHGFLNWDAADDMDCSVYTFPKEPYTNKIPDALQRQKKAG